MLRLQTRILEMVARGDTLKATADSLCQYVEVLLPDILCSVVSVDRSGLLHPLSGPALPGALSLLIEGAAIGPNTGSCGAAAYLKMPVAVTDVATDPRWDRYREPALAAGLLACWSSPIMDGSGRVFGAFAFYYRTKRGPTAYEQDIVSTALHVCSIAFERHERVAERERRANLDELTGLGNRTAFNAMLSGLSSALPGSWGLLTVDLDNLKTINDTFGHHAGDCLLRVTAERLAAAAADDAVFRLGGDEFAVLVQSPAFLRDVEAGAARILDMVGTAASCGGYQIIPKATMGGALFESTDAGSESVRHHADLALYHAKETGRGGFVQYRHGLTTTMTRRLGAIREVELALRDERIDAYYQPVVSLRTGRLVGMEALCRLTTPNNKVLTAAAFQQATADASVALGLTRRMLSIVAADMARWQANGLELPYVAVNLTSADFYRGTLETEILKLFAEARLPLDLLVLEVTEAVHIGRSDHIVARTIAALRARGIRIALDDFGTGFASLTHLLAVPVDIVKIDRSFVNRLGPDSPGTAIVEGLLGINRRLGIEVVAEGIETEDQCAQLRALDCPFGQGYFFSPPMDRGEVGRLLRADGLLPQCVEGAAGSAQPPPSAL